MDSNDLLNVLFPACGALAWAAALYKLVAIRRNRHNPALFALVATIGLPATAFIIAAPAVYLRIDRATGVANLATLLVYGLIVAYSAAALILLQLWHLPRQQARARTVVLLPLYTVVITAMVVMFAASDVGQEHPSDFDAHYGPEPLPGAFLLLYTAAFAGALVTTARLCWHLAHRVDDAPTGWPWLRRGLRLTAAGSLVALGYCAGKASYVLSAWSGVHPRVLNDIAIGCAVAGAMLITLGFTLPSWGPRLTRLRTTAVRFRAYWQLYPLWRLLYQATPDIALDPPPAGPRGPHRLRDLRAIPDIDYLLYRRLIEIRDGRLALETYMRNGQASAGAGNGGTATAEAEAAQIRTAVTRLCSASCPPPEGEAGRDSPPEPDDDLAWLLQVSRAIAGGGRRPATAAEAQRPQT